MIKIDKFEDQVNKVLETRLSCDFSKKDTVAARAKFVELSKNDNLAQAVFNLSSRYFDVILERPLTKEELAQKKIEDKARKEQERKEYKQEILEIAKELKLL